MTTSVEQEIVTPWIINPLFDSIFFSLSIFAGLAYGVIAYGGHSWTRISDAILFLLLGLTHFGATWLFYLDPTNVHYYKTRPTVFFYLPVLLIALSVALAFVGQVTLLKGLTYWFSGIHVMRQSTGFVSLYRSRLRLFSPWERRIDNWLVMGSSFLFLIGRYVRFSDFEFGYSLPHAGIVWLAGGCALIVAIVFVLWIPIVVQRLRAHGKNALPGLLFTIASCLLFSPFLFIPSLNTAFMANLTGHYVQYLSLVWIIQHRKADAQGGPVVGPSLLRRIAGNPSAFFVALFGYGVVVTVMTAVLPYFPAIGLNWAHFFVDRYLFRFRDPFIRSSILPYLKPNVSYQRTEAGV